MAHDRLPDGIAGCINFRSLTRLRSERLRSRSRGSLRGFLRASAVAYHSRWRKKTTHQHRGNTVSKVCAHGREERALVDNSPICIQYCSRERNKNFPALIQKGVPPEDEAPRRSPSHAGAASRSCDSSLPETSSPEKTRICTTSPCTRETCKAAIMNSGLVGNNPT